MLNFKKAVTGLPAAAAWLAMTLAPVLAPSPAFAQAPGPGPAAPFCNNNRFTNGDFSLMRAGQVPDGPGGAPTDQDIDAAEGWGPLWQVNAQGTTSLADLNSATASGTGVLPTPASGNYAAMWIANYGSGGPTYREGMFNQLTSPIAANSGTYSFTFKTAALNAPQAAGVPSVIGIYGVYRAPSAALPVALNALNGHNVPSNLALFGTNTTVLLGTVQVPTTAGKTWANQSITFDSANFGAVQRITHVMVTKMDGGTVNQARYFAFDDFCMQIATPPPPVFSACCPPWTSVQLYTMLSHQATGVSATPYRIRFAAAATLNSRMNAYVNYLKTLGMGFSQARITFQLVDAGAGAAPNPIGAPVGTAYTMDWTGGAPPSANFFPTNLSANRWYRVDTHATLRGGPRDFLPRDCGHGYVHVRLQLVPGGQAILQFRLQDGTALERPVQL